MWFRNTFTIVIGWKRKNKPKHPWGYIILYWYGGQRGGAGSRGVAGSRAPLSIVEAVWVYGWTASAPMILAFEVVQLRFFSARPPWQSYESERRIVRGVYRGCLKHCNSAPDNTVDSKCQFSRKRKKRLLARLLAPKTSSRLRELPFSYEHSFSATTIVSECQCCFIGVV